MSRLYFSKSQDEISVTQEWFIIQGYQYLVLVSLEKLHVHGYLRKVNFICWLLVTDNWGSIVYCTANWARVIWVRRLTHNNHTFKPGVSNQLGNSRTSQLDREHRWYLTYMNYRLHKCIKPKNAGKIRWNAKYKWNNCMLYVWHANWTKVMLSTRYSCYQEPVWSWAEDGPYQTSICCNKVTELTFTGAHDIYATCFKECLRVLRGCRYLPGYPKQ